MKRFLMLLLALLLLGCRAVENPINGYEPDESERLILYTSHKKEVYEPIVREFEERTGIWVTVVNGGTNELLDEIEAHPDDPICDVMFGGGVDSLLSCRDLFLPYACSEDDAVSEAYRTPDDRVTPFSALPIVLIYHTKLVDPENLSGWSSLLDPAWKGKIAFADPNVSGSSYTALRTLCECIGGDRDEVMRTFADNIDGKQLSGSGEVLRAVADGRFPIGVTLEETAWKYILADNDIGVVYPAEGTSAVPDGCAILNNAPHMDNAKLFVEFILGRDVQTMLVSEQWRRSVRADVPAPEALPDANALSLIRFNYRNEIRMHGEVLALWTALTEEQP
mgnify:CR=1 FL=1